MGPLRRCLSLTRLLQKSFLSSLSVPAASGSGLCELIWLYGPIGLNLSSPYHICHTRTGDTLTNLVDVVSLITNWVLTSGTSLSSIAEP